MATRWRRRRMCVLVADAPAPAALRMIDAAGAVIETSLRPALGAPVTLRHPDAGEIAARVSALAADAVTIGFEIGPESVAFALAAIAADMSRPA
ncbi:hypothetical protein [Sphingosinicella sp.]|uniref:hypothetical protein n=1 Tax=Sphingosinicella sp. TaxID=1917971 RepID=UPI004037DF17